jgi:hypothetical protein
MQVSSDKVIDAIAALKAAADALLAKHPCDTECQYARDVGMQGHSCSNGCMYDSPDAPKTDDAKLAARCLESAAALQASVQIAGQTHRTFHVTGVH